jgi:hypothetical protein
VDGKYQVNEHHEHILKSVGEWELAGKLWTAPGEAPTETKGYSKITSILDGRFVQHEYATNFAGAPYAGLGIDGYDRMADKYVSLWIDTMSTGFTLMEGQREGQVTTQFAKRPMIKGSSQEVKSVATYNDDDMLFAMYDKEGDDWRITMELSYQRKN